MKKIKKKYKKICIYRKNILSLHQNFLNTQIIMKKIYVKGSRQLEVYFLLTIQFGDYRPEKIIVIRNPISGLYHFRHFYSPDIFGCVYGSDGHEYESVSSCVRALYTHLSECF